MTTTEIKQQLSEGVKIAVKTTENRIVNIDNDLYIFNLLTGNKITLESYENLDNDLFVIRS